MVSKAALVARDAEQNCRYGPLVGDVAGSLAPGEMTFVFRQMSITYDSGSEPDVMPDVATFSPVRHGGSYKFSLARSARAHLETDV